MSTATYPNQKTDLVEYTSAGSKLIVDKENHVIHGVKILGFDSKNGREYSAGAMRGAIKLYDNVQVFVNHQRKGETGPRAYQDRLGTIRNVQFREGAGIFGDLHYNPNHPAASQLEFDAQAGTGNVGLSHVAQGRTIRQNGREIVETIYGVKSVDLVAEPATTSSLCEHLDKRPQTFFESLHAREANRERVSEFAASLRRQR